MNGVAFQGGERAIRRWGIAGVAGLVLTGLGALVDVRQALYSYLVAYTYWVGIVVGALLLLMAFHASNARWPVVVRRVVEVIPLTLPVFVVLFIPILAGMKQLFPWMTPGAGSAEAARLWQVRRPYLNPGFFVVRAGFYFLAWIVIAELLRAWSVRQDREGGLTLTLWQRRLGAGGLPLVGLAMTFASFDWVMSLEAEIASTIFGPYYFAGSFLGALAVLILATLAGMRHGIFGEAEVTTDHLHSMGKFLFAFFCFWAYMAFSQWMLTWIANIPHEVPWYLFRDRGGWGPVGIFLILFHFVVPFFVMLSRSLKRSPRGLTVMAIWALVVHYVDIYWLIMPRLHRDSPAPSWMSLTALVGIGGVALAFGLWRLRGSATVPVGDPYLVDSVRYEPE